jgi:hypothetical protein
MRPRDEKRLVCFTQAFSLPNEKTGRNAKMLNVKATRRFKVIIEYDLIGPPGMEVDKWRAIIPNREAMDVSFAIAECPAFHDDRPEREDKAALAKVDRMTREKAGIDRTLQDGPELRELTLLDHIRAALTRISDLDALTDEECYDVGHALDELIGEVRKRWVAREQPGQKNGAITWHKRASEIPGHFEYGDAQDEDEDHYAIVPMPTKTGRFSYYAVTDGGPRMFGKARTIESAMAIAQEHADSNPA